MKNKKNEEKKSHQELCNESFVSQQIYLPHSVPSTKCQRSAALNNQSFLVTTCTERNKIQNFVRN